MSWRMSGFSTNFISDSTKQHRFRKVIYPADSKFAGKSIYAEVAVWRIDGEGWANTFTDGDGAYSLSLGEGEWRSPFIDLGKIDR